MNTQKKINVLIPTYRRSKALAVTLTGLYYQIESDFDIVISDQAPEDDLDRDNSVQTVIRMLRNKGVEVSILKNLPSRGMAQQRHFLLEHCQARFALFLDDDLVCESYVLRNMVDMIQKQKCGFVGSAVIGLSYENDHRPHQQSIEFWEEGVLPENIVPQGKEWQRYVLHNAANIHHVAQKYNASPGHPVPYKVAWVGGCVMYDTEKLKQCGGFSFWKDLPETHCGEDVLAQLKVMKKYGGCGILPSGVYHQELETTLPDRTVNAPQYLEI